MFGLIGFSREASGTATASGVNIDMAKALLAMLAVPSYIMCLGFGTEAIRDRSGIRESKISKCEHLINTFLITAGMVGMMAALTVIGQLEVGSA